MKRILGVTAAAIAAVAATACASPMRPSGPPTHRSDRVALHAPGVDPAAAARVAQAAEETVALFEQALDVRLPELTIDLHPDRRAYRAAGGRGDGMYFPDDRRVLIFVSGDPHVLRHEIAHHAAVHVVGVLPPWLNEGIAEYLETIRSENGRAVVGGLAPHHLEATLSGATGPAAAGGFHFHALDYARSWALVAWLLEDSEGTLAERLESLRRAAPVPIAELERRRRATWRLPERWLKELESRAAAGDAASARALRLLEASGREVQSASKRPILHP